MDTRIADRPMPEATEAVRFTGTTAAWFRIWIVNLVLTILTLGIYSAWAKVRREQYFKRSTLVAGRGFDYHATGLQILIGRVVVIAAVVALQILASLDPLLGLAALVPLVVLFPWLAIRSLRFNARNTSWSNVRFDFAGRYGDAFVTFVLAPVGVALTLYTTAPLLSRRIHRFYVAGHRLGTRAFLFGQGAAGYYIAAAVAVVWTLMVGTIAAAVAVGPIAQLALAAEGDAPLDPVRLGALMAALYGGLILGYYPAVVLFRAMTRNLMYAGTMLEGGHRFESTVHPLRVTWIAISNAAAVLASLGLLLPWAQIRMTRYLADNTLVHPDGALDAIAGRIEEDGRAIGDAYSDIEGIDFGGVGI